MKKILIVLILLVSTLQISSHTISKTEIEEDLVIESWMTTPFEWNSNEDNFKEDELIIEDWMIQPEKW